MTLTTIQTNPNDAIVFPGSTTTPTATPAAATAPNKGKKVAARATANTATLCHFGPEKSLLTLNFQLPASPSTAAVKASASDTIFVVDVSGSMAGSPINAVQSALQYVLSRGVDVTIITYNTEAQTGRLSDVLPRLRAGGGTSFAAALQAVCKAISPMRGTVSVIFMSDGQDNAGQNDLGNAEYQLKVLASNKTERSVVVSTVAFGKDANLDFLQKLTLLGTIPGFARFAESGDGAQQLYEKLADLYDVMGNVLNVTLSCQGPMDGRKVTANIEKPAAAPGEAENKPGASAGDQLAVCELWLTKAEAAGLGAVSTPGAELPTVTVITTYGAVVSLPLVEAEPSALARLRELESRQPVTMDGVKAIARELGELDIYGKKFSLTERSELIQARQLVVERLTEYSRILAEVSIDENVRSAKLRDLNHDFKFSKARRQRKMHERAAANASRIDSITKAVQSLTFDESELPQDGGVFECDLSHELLPEIMKDSVDDVLGFGLRVSRQEHVIDAPTSLRVEAVSSTFISRSSFESGVLYTVEQQGLVAAHGDFEGKAGCAFVGRARESINAFLPMYICRPHAERVRATLEPLLGYLFSLSPFGYDRNQRTALYSVLGSMLMQLPAVRNERAQLIVDEFAKLCGFIASDAATLEVVPADYVTKFVDDYSFRMKGEVPNLLTVPGYAYATTTDLGPDAAASRASLFAKLLPALYEEGLHRRVMDSVTGDREAAFARLCKLVLSDCPDPTSKPLESEADNQQFKDFFLAQIAQGVKFNGPTPQITIHHESFVPRRVAIVEEVDDQLDAALRDFEVEFVNTLYSRLGLPSSIKRKVKWAAVVQSLRFCNNDAVRSGAASGKARSIVTQADEVIADAAQHCNAQLAAKHTSDLASLDRSVIAVNIAATGDMVCFAGKLRAYCPNRNNAIFDAIIAKLIVAKDKAKIEALLRNKVEGMPVFTVCTVYSPPARIIHNFRMILGEELVVEIEREHKRTGRVGHRYRESDKPNRHGHCNSNPNPLLGGPFMGYEVYHGDATLI